MLKQCLLVLLAAGLISIAVPFTATQSSGQSSNDSPPNNKAIPKFLWTTRWHHGPLPRPRPAHPGN